MASRPTPDSRARTKPLYNFSPRNFHALYYTIISRRVVKLYVQLFSAYRRSTKPLLFSDVRYAHQEAYIVHGAFCFPYGAIRRRSWSVFVSSWSVFPSVMELTSVQPPRFGNAPPRFAIRPPRFSIRPPRFSVEPPPSMRNVEYAFR